MKKIVSIVLVMTMILSVSVTSTVNAFFETDNKVDANEARGIYADENGTMFFEKNDDANVELYAEPEEVTATAQVKEVSREEAAEDAVSLMTTNAEKTVTVERISSYDFYMSEKTITINIAFEEFYDAKNKLKISVADSDDKIVAEQVSCVYSYGWGNVLRYTLKVVEGAEISSDKDYDIKMTYTGSYDFVCDAYYTKVYPANQAAVIRAELVDRGENIFAFYIANFNSEADYVIEFEDVEYEPISIEDNCISFKFDDIDTSNVYNSHTALTFTLYEKNGDSRSYCDYFSMEYLDFDEEYTDDSYNGISTVDKLAVTADSFVVYAYANEKGEEYSAKAAENAVIYMVDSVTGGKVATATIDYSEDYGEIIAKMKITETLVEDRRYFIVADDGETIRLKAVYATDKPCYSFCGIKLDGTDSYSTRFGNADKYELMMFDAYNMPDISKINACIYDSAGNPVITFDKGSAKDKGNASMAENRIAFTMSRQTTLDEDERYYFKLMYDQYTVYNERWNYSETESEEFQGWVYDAYSAENNTYLLFDYVSEVYDETDLEFVLKSNIGDTELTGKYQRTLYSDYDKYIVVKFDGTVEGSYSDISLIVKSGSKELYNKSSVYINEVSLPFVYDYTNKSRDGYTILYGEGFEDGNTYELYVFDLVTNSEKKISLTKVKGKNEFKVSNADLNVILDNSGQIEENGVWVGEVSYWTLDSDYLPENEFYAKYKTQNHRLAILYLPIKDYSQYKLADSKDALNNQAFKTIERNVLYTLSEGDGEKTIYAQFKKSDGGLSEIMKTTVLVDTKAPVLSNISDLSETYTVDSYQRFKVHLTLTASENGYAEIAFYNSADCMIGYEQSRSVNSGENELDIYFYTDNYNYTNAKKLVVYMKDKAGNTSEKHSYDVSVVNKYSKYTVGDGYILLNNETQIIEEVYTAAEGLTIPSSINGVSVKGIGDYAFENCSNLKSISIPESVETISENAFEGADVTLKVRENSAAHKFAIANKIKYEIITVEPGDITADGQINRMDLLRLAKYFAGWEVEIDETAADVTGDGKLNRMDLLRLAKYFAGWNVALGQ